VTSRARRLRVCLISPFHGGSHRAWAEGLARQSVHDVQILSLPDRFWKWRMEGAALTMAPELEQVATPDLLIATDMIDLAGLLALTRRKLAQVPTMLYMHENQLTYSAGAPAAMRLRSANRDRYPAMVNLTSMAVADSIVFNSEFHRADWFAALPAFLDRLPEALPAATVGDIQERCATIPVGIETAELPQPDGTPRPPLIVWNQRWESDKNPAGLFRILHAVAAKGVAFEVALCGESAVGTPDEIRDGVASLGARVVHQGYLPRAAYTRLLGRARVVVSTAHHEFFGISVVEAASVGAHPLLPRRLSYPEVIGPAHGGACLYDGFGDAVARLTAMLGEPDPTRDAAMAVAADMRARYGWSELAPRYDALFERLTAQRAVAR
jgi:glycosyltransferase involved in cell wall biosynthesis